MAALDKKLKILFITQEYSLVSAGGAGVVADELTRALAHGRTEVHVMAPGKITKTEKLADNLFVHWQKVIDKPLLKVPSFHFQVWRHSKKIIQANGIDVVHSNNYAGAFAPRKVPFVSTVHHLARDETNNAAMTQRIIGYVDLYFEKLIIKKSELVTAVSRPVQKQLKAIHPDKNIKLIFNGIDTSLFRRKRAAELRKKLNIDPNEMILFLPGMARAKRKGGLDFVNALEGLNRSNFRCIISGESREIGWKAEFMSAINKAKVNDRFIWVNEVNYGDLPLYYSAADVVVFPSRMEGFGLPIIESLACAVPIICARTGAAEEIISDGANGLLTSPGDSAALGRAMEKLINSKDLRKKLTVNGSKTIKKFSWDYVANEFVDAYKNLAKDFYL